MVDIMDQSGQWSMIPPPSLPVAQAGGGGIEGLLGALLGGGVQSQPGLGGMDPRAIQMLMFQQMNRPAQGPFSAIANPIAALLMARQVAPAIAQQQERQLANERIKQVLEALKVGSGITRDQAAAALSGARTGVLQQEAEVTGAIPIEARVQGELAKRKIIMSPAEEAAAKAADLRAQAAGLSAQAAASQAGTAEARRADAMARFNAKQQMEREQFEKTLGQRVSEQQQAESQFGQKHELDVIREERLVRGQESDIAYRGRRFEQMERQIQAQSGSPEVQEIRLKTARTNLARAEAGLKKAQDQNTPLYQQFQAHMQYTKNLPLDEATAYARENIAPLIAKMTNGTVKIPVDELGPWLSWGWDVIEPPPKETAGQVPVTPQAAPPPVQTPTGTVPPKTANQSLIERYNMKKYGTPYRPQ